MDVLHRLVAAVVLFLVAACSRNPEDGQGGRRLGSPCESSAGCAAPYACCAGTCAFPDCDSFCTPGVKACVGDAVATCNADGSAFDVAGDPCAFGCFAGACVPATCEASGEQRCIDGDLWRCNAAGSGFEVFETCSDGCETGAEGVRCRESTDAGLP